MKSIAIAFVLAFVAAVKAQAVSGNSGTISPLNGVTVQGNGSALISTTGNSINVAADGNGQANIQGFGQVTASGSVSATGSDVNGILTAQVAADGTASGPDGAFAAGAVAGSGFIDPSTGNAGAQGAINGRAGVNGYAVSGAADGRISGNVNTGNIVLAGAVNGCLSRPNGSVDCYDANGNYVGTIYSNGTISTTSFSGQVVNPGSSSSVSSSNSVTTSTTGPTYNAKSGAESLVAGSAMALMAGLVGLAL